MYRCKLLYVFKYLDSLTCDTWIGMVICILVLLGLHFKLKLMLAWLTMEKSLQVDINMISNLQSFCLTIYCWHGNAKTNAPIQYWLWIRKEASQIYIKLLGGWVVPVNANEGSATYPGLRIALHHFIFTQSSSKNDWNTVDGTYWHVQPIHILG